MYVVSCQSSNSSLFIVVVCVYGGIIVQSVETGVGHPGSELD